MRLRGGGKFQRAARWLANGLAPGALILMYHRIAEADSAPAGRISVTPRHFAEHLDVLRAQARPMRLSDLERALLAGRVPQRAVVVTFDDGYADNLLDARPLLERYEIPATVFASSGYLRAGREFWWDELERLVLQPGTLPGTLSIAVDGRRHEWSLGETACYSQDAFRRHRGWNVHEAQDPTPRHHLYRAMYRLAQSLAGQQRWDLLDQLRLTAGAPALCRAGHRPLSPDELVRLADGGLVEVGAHSVTHPVLPALPLPDQRDEIRRSKIELENILGQPVTRFAYPYGSRTAETVALVREAGFSCACSAEHGPVWRAADRFQLPRVGVVDCGGEQFARRLAGSFLGCL